MQNGYNEVTVYKAKPVIDNKFWIVEQNGQRIGTVRKGVTDKLTVVMPAGISKCSDMKELSNKFNIEIVTSKELATTEQITQEKEVHGFPCKTAPYNSMYDIKRKLPLYTKTEKSQSFYCAGYYIIGFEKGWVTAYCPKLLTLGRNEFKGPFKTKLEMQEILKQVQ